MNARFKGLGSENVGRAVFWGVALAVANLLGAGPGFAEGESSGEASSKEKDPLPGYYRFYEKEGNLTRIPEEVARDQQIEGGKLRIRTYEREIPGYELPQFSGEKVSFASYRGKKNLVLAPFRTWW